MRTKSLSGCKRKTLYNLKRSISWVYLKNESLFLPNTDNYNSSRKTTPLKNCFFYSLKIVLMFWPSYAHRLPCNYDSRCIKQNKTKTFLARPIYNFYLRLLSIAGLIAGLKGRHYQKCWVAPGHRGFPVVTGTPKINQAGWSGHDSRLGTIRGADDFLCSPRGSEGGCASCFSNTWLIMCTDRCHRNLIS